MVPAEEKDELKMFKPAVLPSLLICSTWSTVAKQLKHLQSFVMHCLL